MDISLFSDSLKGQWYKRFHPIRLEVITKWLKGYSRDEIAKDVGIGTGTVSGIIQQIRVEDPDFDSLRGVALELRD